MVITPCLPRLADALVAEGAARYSADAAEYRKQRLELTEAGGATFRRMKASFDIWADRLMAFTPQAGLDSVSKALEHIRLARFGDTNYMHKRS